MGSKERQLPLPKSLTPAFSLLPDESSLWGESEGPAGGGRAEGLCGCLALAGQHPVQQATHLWREYPGPPLDPHSSSLLQVRPMLQEGIARVTKSMEGPEYLGPRSPDLCSDILTLLYSTPKDHAPGCFHPYEMLDMMSLVRHWGSVQRVVVTKFDLF